MEFAGYQFELSTYDGSLFSFTTDAHHAFPELAHLSPDKYKAINQYIMQQPATTNDEKWAKAILMSFINIRIYWRHATHIVDDQKKYYWWVFDFTAILENLLVNKGFISGQTTAATNTVLINNVQWAGHKQYHLNPSLVYTPINHANLTIPPVKLVDPSEIASLSDNHFWEEPSIGISTTTDYWQFIYRKLLRRQPQRAIFLYQLVYQRGYTQADAGQIFGISDSRVYQIIHKVNRYIKRDVIHSFDDIDILKTEQPTYHDEHNLLMANYAKIKR